MPLKEFQCNECKHNFEDLVMSDFKPQCPECGSLKVTSMPTAPGGYKISGRNGSSTTPRGSGSWKK